jgi:threonine/homoserine/homoserine lactone efflux protein
VLSDAIGSLLPAAVAVALSPIPVIAVVVMLGTPRARTNGPAFAVGWVFGLLAVGAIVLLLTGGADDPDSATSTSVNWLTLGLGVLFLVLAARQWRSRPTKGQEPTMPTWMARVDGFDAGRSFVLGVALSGANPKNLALTMAAAASIAQAGLDASQNAIALAVFVVIGSSTVAGSVVYYLVARERAGGTLATIKAFMTDHNTVIMMVILLVLGAKLIGDGLSGVTH